MTAATKAFSSHNPKLTLFIWISECLWDILKINWVSVSSTTEKFSSAVSTEIQWIFTGSQRHFLKSVSGVYTIKVLRCSHQALLSVRYQGHTAWPISFFRVRRDVSWYQSLLWPLSEGVCRYAGEDARLRLELGVLKQGSVEVEEVEEVEWRPEQRQAHRGCPSVQ